MESKENHDNAQLLLVLIEKRTIELAIFRNPVAATLQMCQELQAYGGAAAQSTF